MKTDAELTEDSAGRSSHHMLTVVQLPDVLAHVCASDTGVTLNVHVVAQRQQHLKKRTSCQTREVIKNYEKLFSKVLYLLDLSC